VFQTLKVFVSVWVGSKAEVVEQETWSIMHKWNIQFPIELSHLLVNRLWKPCCETGFGFGQKVPNFRVKGVYKFSY